MKFSKVFCIMSILFTTSSGATSEEVPQKVVVIGAGIAGLTTAYRLVQKGFDVSVYEAKNRVGGRILSAKVGDAIAELGAQNITDGGSAQHMHNLIEFLGLELTKLKVGLHLYYFTGEDFLSGSELLKEMNFDSANLKAQLEEIAKQSENMRDVLNALIPEHHPLNKMLTVRLAAYEGASAEKLSPIFIETLYHMLLGGIAAAHAGSDGEQGYIELETIKGGNSLLPEKLAKHLGDRIHLNKPLIAVSRQENGYILTFNDSECVFTDILVLAIPCTVYEDIIFEGDPIPDNRLREIKNILYGSNSKILAPLEYNAEKRMSFVNDHMGAFFNAECNLMTFYYTDTSSHFSKDTVSETFAKDLNMLEKALGKIYQSRSATAYALDVPFATYEGPVGYSWPNDPFIKGSYSTVGTGQEALLLATEFVCGEKVKSLFAPIDGSLYFAGEHTSILSDVPGTMEAACESGERTARLISSLNCLKTP